MAFVVMLDFVYVFHVILLIFVSSVRYRPARRAYKIRCFLILGAENFDSLCVRVCV